MYKRLVLAESIYCVRVIIVWLFTYLPSIAPLHTEREKGKLKSLVSVVAQFFWWHGSSFTIDYEGSSPPFPGQHAHTHNGIIVMTSAVPTAFDHQQVKPERKGPFNSLDDDSALLACFLE